MVHSSLWIYDFKYFFSFKIFSIIIFQNIHFNPLYLLSYFGNQITCILVSLLCSLYFSLSFSLPSGSFSLSHQILVYCFSLLVCMCYNPFIELLISVIVFLICKTYILKTASNSFAKFFKIIFSRMINLLPEMRCFLGHGTSIQNKPYQLPISALYLLKMVKSGKCQSCPILWDPVDCSTRLLCPKFSRQEYLDG